MHFYQFCPILWDRWYLDKPWQRISDGCKCNKHYMYYLWIKSIKRYKMVYRVSLLIFLKPVSGFNSGWEEHNLSPLSITGTLACELVQAEKGWKRYSPSVTHEQQFKKMMYHAWSMCLPTLVVLICSWFIDITVGNIIPLMFYTLSGVEMNCWRV